MRMILIKSNNFYQFNNDLKDVDFSTLSIETLQLDLTTPKINLENVDNIYEEFRTYKIHQIIDKIIHDETQRR